MKFKSFYERNRGRIPDTLLILAWNIMSGSSFELFQDTFFFSPSVYNIHQMMETMDEDNVFSFKSKINTYFSQLMRVLKIFQAHKFYCFLQHKKINLKECIHTTNNAFSDYMIVRTKIRYPQLGSWEDLKKYVDVLCKEAVHQLYRRQCALCIYKHMYMYHSRFIKTHDLIVKNKKDKQPDQMMTVYYHSLFNAFWPHALSSGFGGSFENGHYVVYTNKENTSQEAVYLLCTYSKNRSHGLQFIIDEFYKYSEMEYSIFENWVQRLCVIADKWFYQTILDSISNLFIQYIEDTLGSKWIKSYVRKIELFVTKNKNMAQYIWETNYNTEKDRINFAIKASIGKKFFNGFIKAQTIGELQQYLEKRLLVNKTVYDDLPLHMKKKIREAEHNVLAARRGVRVGRTGIYISSDSISQAESILHNLWRDADKYISSKR